MKLLLAVLTILAVLGLARFVAPSSKLKPSYKGVYLLVFAQGCRSSTIDFPFEQVIAPAIEQVGKAECELIFAGLYVFDHQDDQPLAIFELK